MRIGKKFISLFLRGYNVKVKDTKVKYKIYLRKKQNNVKIYKGRIGKLLIFPFNMTFDEIDRLILINFEGDAFYYALELQIFKLDNNEYPLVILYRKDDLIDIYYTNPKVIENRGEIMKDIINYVSFNQPENIDFKLNVDEFGLDSSLYLKDKFNRLIEFTIREYIFGRKLTAMLLPISTERKKPQYFPIVHLMKFGIVIKQNTKISIKIGAEERIPSELPFKMNGMRNYLIRYSLNPIICNWNNAYEGNLPIIIADNETSTLTHNNSIYTLYNNNGYIEIKKILGKDKKSNELYFEFSPAIPNLLALKDNIELKGRFSCCVNDKGGIFAGSYLINTTENKISIKILPIKVWQPFPGSLWFKTYQWNSKIVIEEDKNIRLNSGWMWIKK
jgi:hypothetical protein